ncbi:MULTISPECIES: hypothetical protein [Paracoccus]|jgi:Flp pilus assembly protein TadB|uniref:Uncharacterized protein n=1 Tax=Paracoccus marcusii TaxID=59779 RepID=A0ABY7UVU5_9RHOB|nr:MULTISPECIES: hypothetical protein [Paracoccus]QXI64835.1 hypothetical protein CP157_02611 [Paracoccus marcusii]TYP67200.1 hypothetical protein A9A71_10838 [Stutzerimonas stutzeri]WDA14045.1 hypothetical protein PRL19_07275 [Paracoccus marcusii]WVJ72364.1 hypothetical protein FLP41_18005 [Paracoccus marcusii]|tara:strand:+ start:522 stop:695 length:174 start_codon:yes stop_codon:yes gene_type:complete
MPLTHFLALIAVTILAAAVTLWAGLSAGVPPIAFLLLALSGAVLVHLNNRDRHDHDG